MDPAGVLVLHSVGERHPGFHVCPLLVVSWVNEHLAGGHECGVTHP